eukprot:TRINITY_DN24406_c0_g1_i1.p1 TRINITY_DN24406_c0_g1~~TRINITY_DN24406_c0_g1_i1.p1  ORF type:complete len:138 (-),score=47.96 TRINITY_DN24406_c0_g1_i1:118-531(-)
MCIRDSGQLVDKSQKYTDEWLGNLVPVTRWLPAKARELGALAASAFGAGFGGSVWAVVKQSNADEFLAAWREAYSKDPACAESASHHHCEFFKMRPGPGAFSLSGQRWCLDTPKAAAPEPAEAAPAEAAPAEAVVEA